MRGHTGFSRIQGMIKILLCFVFLLLPNLAAADDSALSDDGRFVEEFLTNPDVKKDVVVKEFSNVLKEIFRRCGGSCKFSEFHGMFTKDFGIQCPPLEAYPVKKIYSYKSSNPNEKTELYMLCYANKIAEDYILQKNITMGLYIYNKSSQALYLRDFEIAGIGDVDFEVRAFHKAPIFLVTDIYSETQIKNILKQGLIEYCKEALSDQCLLTNNATRWKIKSSNIIGMAVDVTLKLAADGEVIHIGLSGSKINY